MGRYALRTWLRRRGLRALSTRPQRPRTTVTDPAAVVAENLLLGQPAPTAPNTEPVLIALEQALTLRQPPPGLIIHADCGRQCTSAACRAHIARHQPASAGPAIPTTTPKPKPAGPLKTELLPHGGACACLEEARLEVAHYLATYFNLDR